MLSEYTRCENIVNVQVSKHQYNADNTFLKCNTAR